MWHAWRPFLVLVLIDTTLKELGSGAPSVGSNSNEIPVNAQEPLSATRNGAQPDRLTQLLSSLESNLEGIQALASLLNRTNTTKSTSNRIAQQFNGGAGVEDEPAESCRFKRTNAVGEPGLGGCAAGCASLFPAIQGQGQCLCPRNTKADCETINGCSWSVVAQLCNHQFDGLYNALFKKLDKRGDTSEFTEEPYEFAYSIAISPVAAAGGSVTAELGLAVDTSGQVLVFATFCTGLKADISIEADIVLGHWSSLDDIIGRTYALGFGVDGLYVEKDAGNRETGANFEILFDMERKLIGGTISLGYGRGPKLPVDSEVNFDDCERFQVLRFNLTEEIREFFSKFL